MALGYEMLSHMSCAAGVNYGSLDTSKLNLRDNNLQSITLKTFPWTNYLSILNVYVSSKLAILVPGHTNVHISLIVILRDICSHRLSRQAWIQLEEILDLVCCESRSVRSNPGSKVHEANMGPIWGRQDSGGPHVAPMNLAILVVLLLRGKLAGMRCALFSCLLKSF